MLELFKSPVFPVNDEHIPIIEWSNNGKSFKIHNEKRFVNEIMPQYYFQSPNNVNVNVNVNVQKQTLQSNSNPQQLRIIMDNFLRNLDSWYVTSTVQLKLLAYKRITNKYKVQSTASAIASCAICCAAFMFTSLLTYLLSLFVYLLSLSLFVSLFVYNNNNNNKNYNNNNNNAHEFVLYTLLYTH
jgi:hypothetical protein